MRFISLIYNLNLRGAGVQRLLKSNTKLRKTLPALLMNGYKLVWSQPGVEQTPLGREADEAGSRPGKK